MLDAKSVSPTTTIEVCAIVPSSFSIGVLPNSEMANESYREKYGLQMAQIPYNFMWVNIYKDIKTVVQKGSWWGNSEEVLGIKPSVLYDYGDNIEADRRYYYEMKLQINGTDAPAFVIFNFTSPSDVDAMINQTKKYVMPHFLKKMKSSGMLGWGLGTKITPQGEEFSSVMTYDSYDSLENVMLHLAGKSVMEGLPFDKLTPVDWTMRPVMRVISVTDPR